MNSGFSLFLLPSARFLWTMESNGIVNNEHNESARLHFLFLNPVSALRVEAECIQPDNASLPVSCVCVCAFDCANQTACCAANNCLNVRYAYAIFHAAMPFVFPVFFSRVNFFLLMQRRKQKKDRPTAVSEFSHSIRIKKIFSIFSCCCCCCCYT